MSDLLNNREHRRELLKRLIRGLHDGRPVDEVRKEFQAMLGGVSSSEISEMEAELIREGMPIEEVQRLCDVHSAVFDGSVESEYRESGPQDTPGHPVHVFRMENRAIDAHVTGTMIPRMKAYAAAPSSAMALVLAADIQTLQELDKHYSRKENLLFPYMERYGITAPPKVMWGVDDEIRAGLKRLRAEFIGSSRPAEALVADLDALIARIRDMIVKEENILFPLVLQTLTEDEWISIRDESADIGFCLCEPEEEWKPVRSAALASAGVLPADASLPDSLVHLETGTVTLKQLEALLGVLPIDLTFIDAEDSVRWFSNGPDRIFARTKAVIGRKVQNCHPPASVHVVEALLRDFRAGVKDHEDFWIRMGPRFILIRYFAVRDAKGVYLGTVELSQDIGPIQAITGEKRIMEP